MDDIMLVQEYIKAPEPCITRMEFVGSKFVYAVRVDTSQGFELCPAEACRIDIPAAAQEVCAIDAGEGLFRIMPECNDPIVGKLEHFLSQNKVEVAGVEFIKDKSGKNYVYDTNTNTNYNPEAEKKPVNLPSRCLPISCAVSFKNPNQTRLKGCSNPLA